MTFNWKYSAGAFALSVAIMLPASGQMAEAKPIETGQIREQATCKNTPVLCPTAKAAPAETPAPTETPSVEKGIKDPGIKSCGNCGLTGREAAPPATGDGAAPPSAEKVEQGQLRDKIKLPPPTVAKTKGPKVRDDGARDTSLLSIVGGVSAIAAIVALAAGGGDDNPTSP